MVLCVHIVQIVVPDISISCKKSCRKLIIFLSALSLDVPFSLKLGWQFIIMTSASGYKESEHKFG